MFDKNAFFKKNSYIFHCMSLLIPLIISMLFTIPIFYILGCNLHNVVFQKFLFRFSISMFEALPLFFISAIFVWWFGRGDDDLP